MVDYFAFCILSTWLGARIDASLIDTSPVGFTFRVHHTFWFAIWWRTHIIWKA